MELFFVFECKKCKHAFKVARYFLKCPKCGGNVYCRSVLRRKPSRRTQYSF